eukprot:COSAG02_NODE_692_length_18432_cov_12.452681_13_plen_47_part_01
MDAMDDIQNEVDRFLEHSAYSFLDLGISSVVLLGLPRRASTLVLACL